MLKNYFLGKKALFFDLDGTIIDSLALWKQAYISVLDKNDMDIINVEDVYYCAYSAMIWKRLISDYKLETKKTIQQLVDETNQEYVRMFKQSDIDVRDGFWQMVREVIEGAKFKLALVSNSDNSVVTAVLEKLWLNEDVFDLIICGDQVKNRKPRPDIYLAAAQKLGIKSSEALVFEDSVSGSMSAAAAKMDMVIIWDGTVKETEYKGNILTFVPDFNGFPGNMDKTYWDYIKDEASKLETEETKEEEKPSVPAEGSIVEDKAANTPEPGRS